MRQARRLACVDPDLMRAAKIVFRLILLLGVAAVMLPFT